MREEVVLERDVEVTAIPYGDRISLQKGHPVIITQALGGSYTLVTMQGYMVRLDGPDADAIGKEPQAAPTAEEAASKTVDQLVWDQLRSCYDPEIPVNIVDLGLVYSCEIGPEGDAAAGSVVDIKMTLTAPGCGMGPVLAQDVKEKVQALPGVTRAEVEIVFDPQWSKNMMTEAALLQLGLM
jgi:probable FeS assembly SUF system protein SufT